MTESDVSTVTLRPAEARDAEAIAALFTDEGYPAGPSDIIERLAREISAGLADAGVQKRFAEVGAITLPYTPSEMRTVIARDVEKWARVIKLAGIQPQ